MNVAVGATVFDDGMAVGGGALAESDTDVLVGADWGVGASVGDGGAVIGAAAAGGRLWFERAGKADA